MRARLLDFVVCPKCRSGFALHTFLRTDASGGDDVETGVLQCTGCGARFPVIRGVPRLLPRALLGRMRGRYPEFFAAHPEFLPAQSGDRDALGDTLDSFTRQHLDVKPAGPEVAHQWRENLTRNLGRALAVGELHDKAVLDVGCGFGRHLYVASQAGAECVGVDLSGGVDVARLNTLGYPRCHVVQANIHERPLREGQFDVVWSFGVLHQMPDPRAGFRAIVPLARPHGGLVVIWVYGYRGMALTYKLSHMRPLHRITRNMSDASRVAASKAVAGALSGFYWEPLRLARKVGLRGVVDRMPLTAYIDHGWMSRVAAVHDRLSTPITHFHDHDDLLEWLGEARLAQPTVEDTERRGWRAYGWRRVNGHTRA